MLGQCLKFGVVQRNRRVEIAVRPFRVQRDNITLLGFKLEVVCRVAAVDRSSAIVP